MNLYIVRIGNSYVRGIRYYDKHKDVVAAAWGRGGDPLWSLGDGRHSSVCLTTDRDSALKLLGFQVGAIAYHYKGKAFPIEEEA